MQALILAAGMGKRLGELTHDRTKCMVSVGGRCLIDRTLDALEEAGINRVTIVVGYKGQVLKDHLKANPHPLQIEYVENPIYDKTNNIYSLFLAKDVLLHDDTLLVESDLIFEPAVIHRLLDSPVPDLALVDRYSSWMDGTIVRVSEGGEILEFANSKKIAHNDGWFKTVNIYKFSRSFSEHYYVPFLEAYCQALGHNEYYEQVLKVISMLDNTPLRAVRLGGEHWYEIDDVQDLDIAESLFEPDDEKRYHLMAKRYGGYWRYANLLDYCYLVNPYYPPQRMIDEMKECFDGLLRNYPSGMSVCSMLVAQSNALDVSQIVVGNGAAELIKSLVEHLKGSVGILTPTFEEYPNRVPSDVNLVRMHIDGDLRYGADEVMDFFGAHPVDTLLVVNPNNPSGNYIVYDELLKLLEWCESQKTRLVIDESFIDFSDEDRSMLDAALLEAHPSLVVVKSISKSHGVPGLRLGVLASGDSELIDWMKRDVAIWNINSFAEFYLQIFDRYKNDFAWGKERYRTERNRFAKELDKIPILRRLPSQANFFLCEVLGGWSSKALAVELLRHDIFIKDCSSKMDGRNFVRLSIRDEYDNDKLIAALQTLKPKNL